MLKFVQRKEEILTGFEFTPILKIIAAYLLSIISATYSLVLYNKTEKSDMKNFAQVIWGIGVGIAFIATYSATMAFISLILLFTYFIFEISTYKQFNTEFTN